MLRLSKQVSLRKLRIVAPPSKLAIRDEEDLDHGQGWYFGAPNPVDGSKPMVASG